MKKIILLSLAQILMFGCKENSALSHLEETDPDLISPKIEEKVETYIIKKTNAKYYHSIEFGDKKAFDLNQLIKDYENPNIYYDDPDAFKQNKEAFEWLKAFNNKANIAYYMTLIYGLKEKNSDPWDPYWVIVLFDNKNKIIGHFHYAP